MLSVHHAENLIKKHEESKKWGERGGGDEEDEVKGL